MDRVLGWGAIGVVAMFGGMGFALRSAVSLQLGLSLPTILVACALGSALAGAVIARHAVTRPAREIVISAGAAYVLLLVLSAAKTFDRSIIEPVAQLSPGVLVVLAAAVLAAAAAGSIFARRIPASTPSTPLLLVASGLLMMGTVLLVSMVAGFVWVFLLAVVAAGFFAQAIAPVRRPWTCGAGGVLVVLVAQQDGAGVLETVIGVGVLVLLGTIGARIAGRVFAERFTASSSPLPSARVE